MPDPRFLLTFPLYVIVQQPKMSPLTCVGEDDESVRAIAMFTEELLAEPTRDAQMPNGEIWTFPTLVDLQHHLTMYQAWGFEYIAIDPHEETGRSPYLLIEDLLDLRS